MATVQKQTRETTTTTYSLSIHGSTLGDVRAFIETTRHLSATAPLQSDIFGMDLTVHETRVKKETA